MITTFHIPTKIISGPGAFSRMGSEAARLGSHALLVTGKTSMRAAGLLDKAVNNLKANGVDVIIFDRVEPNPRSVTVDAGAQIVRDNHIDMIIALGGGSVMDASKGILIAAAGGKPIWHYVKTGEKVLCKAPVLISIPTVAASGSESNCGAVITNWETHEKCVVGQECAYAAVSIVDPELTLTLPLKPTLQGGVDIFCHLFERYITAKNPAPLTDGILETAMKMVIEQLPKVKSDLNDINARAQLSWASTIACSAFASLGGGDGSLTLHGIEHPLSGYYDIAHGDGLAALLPAWMEYTYPAAQERFDKAGLNVFSSDNCIASINNWLAGLGMNLNLTGLGIEEAKIDEMAECVPKTAPWVANHPLPLDPAHVSQIYRRSL